jgi:hypothetical protein
MRSRLVGAAGVPVDDDDLSFTAELFEEMLSFLVPDLVVIGAHVGNGFAAQGI